MFYYHFGTHEAVAKSNPNRVRCGAPLYWGWGGSAQAPQKMLRRRRKHLDLDLYHPPHGAYIPTPAM